MSITIQTLFSTFKETREWNKLSVNSKKTYQQMMTHAEKDYFLITNRANQITEDFVDKLYEKLKTTKSVSHATMFMKVMRRIWSVCKRKKLVKNNPFKEMGLQTPKAREIRWDKSEVEKYIQIALESKYYDVMLVAALCYELGQRPGDMKRLVETKEGFNSDFTEVKFIQQKTHKRMYLPIYTERLQKYLKAFLPKVIIHNEHDFLALHRDVLAKANLPSYLQMRDLRRTALLEIMEANATDAEGQSISGHVNRQELNTYSPSTLQMAMNAMSKRFG